MVTLITYVIISKIGQIEYLKKKKKIFAKLGKPF